MGREFCVRKTGLEGLAWFILDRLEGLEKAVLHLQLCLFPFLCRTDSF